MQKKATDFIRFSKAVDDFRRIFDREGGIAHQPLLVSEN